MRIALAKQLVSYAKKVLTLKKIDNIGDHEDIDLETDPEVLARHEDIGSDRGFSAKGYQDQVRNVLVYEAYIMLDAEGTGTATLHKVIKAGNSVLDMEEVDRRPFVSFAPLPKPHSFYGSNFADRLCPTQNARTVLTRSILDHAMITNNPRYMVVKGALTSPRELIDNRNRRYRQRVTTQTASLRCHRHH